MGFINRLFVSNSLSPEQAIDKMSKTLVEMVSGLDFSDKLKDDFADDKKNGRYCFLCESHALIMYLHLFGRHLEQLPVHYREPIMIGAVDKTIKIHVRNYAIQSKKRGVELDIKKMMDKLMSEADKKNQEYYKCKSVVGGPYLMGENTVLGDLIENIRPWISLNPVITIPLAAQIGEQIIPLAKITTSTFKKVR